MKFEISEKEIETLLKILSDYENVIMKRLINEIRKKDFKNIKGKQDFIFNFLTPFRIKLTEQKIKQEERNK